MPLSVKHEKVNNIAAWTQIDLNAQIALGNFPPGTLIADITLSSDWNSDHVLTGTASTGQLGTGTANSSVFLRGDGTWSNNLISTSATAFAVGQNGVVNSVFSVDASNNGGYGFNVASSGGATVLRATGSGADADIDFRTKGNGTFVIGGGAFQIYAGGPVATVSQTDVFFTNFNRNFTNNTAFTFSSKSGVSFQGVNVKQALFSFGGSGQIQQHINAALPLSYDMQIIPMTHEFDGSTAAVSTTMAGLEIEGAPISGNRNSNTNTAAIYSPGRNVLTGTGTSQNSYGIWMSANTGATINYAARFDGLTMINGGQVLKRTAVADANYTVSTNDYLVSYTSLTAGRAVTLPICGSAANPQFFIIKDETGQAASFNITIFGASGTIDGSSSKSISAAYGMLRVYCNGTNFFQW